MSQWEKRIRDLFRTAPKGETSELRKGLVSQYAHERKDAIERTIHAMTLGKDVSGLFPDILKNLATHDLEQKKLVYLYLMNYAKTHPELCILAVNTFVQDTEDPNPLVRALAIRTMGCIRVDKMVDYMNLPLQKTLKDENPYVRKTAAICVAKLFDLNPQLAIEEGFVAELQNLMDDANPMVVANTVSALAEIQDAAPETKCFEITSTVLVKLLAALNECTEWGRIAILTALADYHAENAEESGHICDRVVPQFQHVNPSVVLAAIKAAIAHMPSQSHEVQETLKRKMSSPLVTLLSTPPELQYVALRNIRIILQKYPSIAAKELRVFFCKYNDPLYLKLEKIEIMVNIANDSNVKQLITELGEYCHEVDMEFVRRAIRALGQCAIKLESCAPTVVDCLLDLLDNKISYIDQEVMIVMRDILRKYSVFEDAIPRLCDSIEEIDEPESRAAIVWILGEYSDKIPPIKSLLAPFCRSFLEEGTQVQLQILTAAVKLYIKRSEEGKDLIHELLQTATSKSDNADIRDRAYVYWRVLSSDPAVAKQIVLAERPVIDSTIEKMPESLLNELLGELSTLASVYHKSPASFMGRGQYGSDEVQKRAIEEQRQAKEELNADNLLDLDSGEPAKSDLNMLTDIFMTQPGSGNAATTAAANSASDDILSLFASVTAAPAKPASSSTAADPFGFDSLSISSPGQPAVSPSVPAASTTTSKTDSFDDLFTSAHNTASPAPSPAPTSSQNDLLDLF